MIEPSVGLRLDDLQHALGAGRPDRNDHDPVGLELLQQRRRNMVDAAGDDDLVERRRLFPAVIAVGVLGADRLELVVAVLDEFVVDARGCVRRAA